MDIQTNSPYKVIAALNESHKIYLVQDTTTNKIYVQKILDVYNTDIYRYLYNHHIQGTPQIKDIFANEHQLIVIEQYISGISLQEKIDSRTITEEDVYSYLHELCAILELLHSVHPAIIHRDIKPSNIIITEHNHVILLDFNAAKYYHEEQSNDTMLLGTKGYAAPEQYGFGSSTPRTDIYALGILLREMTGYLYTVPQDIQNIIDKCTQLNPDERYASIQDIRNIILPNAKTQTKNDSPSSRIQQYLFPGFRNLTPWKMLLATPIYLFITWLCLSLTIENISGSLLWIERIIVLCIFLSLIFIPFNYLNIQSYFPLCNSKNKFIHYIGIAIFIILVFFALMMIMLITESIFM